jgi:hypothetical protein
MMPLAGALSLSIYSALIYSLLLYFAALICCCRRGECFPLFAFYMNDSEIII